jgi:predicted SAM-dependent methyltransferase
MEKLNYLNVGCGAKFHKAWVNVDIVPSGPEVIKSDLLKGINFPDNTFDVIYHSQVIEHIPKNKVSSFIHECYRVLKPEGIIRIVTPDLENIAKNYLFWLDKCLETPDEMNMANYDWMVLEMYDQTVRSSIGGNMGRLFGTDNLLNEQFILERTGFSGKEIRTQFTAKQVQQGVLERVKSKSLKQIIHAITKKIDKGFLKVLLSKKKMEYLELGKFRMSGEIHYWMYDRFSLTRLLQESGFRNISLKNAFSSNIPNFDSFELDVKDGIAFDPTSLFIEGIK